MKRFYLGMVLSASLLVLGASGCGDDEAEKQEANAGDRGGLGEEDICGGIVYEAIAWDGANDLGLTAAEAFAPHEGTCTSTLVWDASGWGNATPETGESEIAVTLTFDAASAEFGRLENADTEPACDGLYLRATASAAIATADGVFDDSGDVSVVYRDTTGGIDEIALKKAMSETGGTFTVDDADGDATSLTYRFDGAGETCAGSIGLSLTSDLGDGVASMAMGDIGFWSNTGCPVGQEPVDLEAVEKDGVTALAQLEAIWSDLSFAATWPEGDSTELAVGLSLLSSDACREGTSQVAAMSALVTYGTSDGNLGERTVTGDLSVSIEDDGTARASEVHISDDRRCGSTSDSLDYGFGDCSTLSGITIQLGLSWSNTQGWSVSDEGLEIYEYAAGTEPFEGPSANNRELALTF